MGQRLLECIETFKYQLTSSLLNITAFADVPCLQTGVGWGPPISGDIGRVTIRESIAFAQSLVSFRGRPKGFIQLAGGTNIYTVDGLKKQGLFQTTSLHEKSDNRSISSSSLQRIDALVGGVAFGGYARKSLRARTEKALIDKHSRENASRLVIKQLLTFALDEKSSSLREMLLEELAKGLDALGLATVDSVSYTMTASIQFLGSCPVSSMTSEDIVNLTTLQRLVFWLSQPKDQGSSNVVPTGVPSALNQIELVQMVSIIPEEYYVKPLKTELLFCGTNTHVRKRWTMETLHFGKLNIAYLHWALYWIHILIDMNVKTNESYELTVHDDESDDGGDCN